MAYATTAQLATYLGIAEVDLPADASRQLTRADELIDDATLGSIDTTDTDHAQAARDAVCAQVEYWLEVDESEDIIGKPDGMQIGSFRISAQGKSPLAPRAKRYLKNAGLLYKGVLMI